MSELIGEQESNYENNSNYNKNESRSEASSKQEHISQKSASNEDKSQNSEPSEDNQVPETKSVENADVSSEDNKDEEEDIDLIESNNENFEESKEYPLVMSNTKGRKLSAFAEPSLTQKAVKKSQVRNKIVENLKLSDSISIEKVQSHRKNIFSSPTNILQKRFDYLGYKTTDRQNKNSAINCAFLTSTAFLPNPAF